MAKKKQLTEAEIKNKLYAAFLEDLDDCDEEWPDFTNVGDAAQDIWDSLASKVIEVKSFKVTLADRAKIRSEVESSCLTPAAKKAILAATK